METEMKRLEEYKRICRNCNVLPYQRFSRNYTKELFHQGEREELVVKVVEQSKQVIDFESATDFINQSL